MSRWWQYLSVIFANRLKSERESKGWTQEQFAEIIGVSNGTVSGYERNYREPDFDTLIKIARQLNVSIDYLLGYSDIRNPRNETNNSKANEVKTPTRFDGLITQITELLNSSKRTITKKEEEFILIVISEYIKSINNGK